MWKGRGDICEHLPGKCLLICTLSSFPFMRENKVLHLVTGNYERIDLLVFIVKNLLEQSSCNFKTKWMYLFKTWCHLFFDVGKFLNHTVFFVKATFLMEDCSNSLPKEAECCDHINYYCIVNTYICWFWTINFTSVGPRQIQLCVLNFCQIQTGMALRYFPQYVLLSLQWAWCTFIQFCKTSHYIAYLAYIYLLIPHCLISSPIANPGYGAALEMLVPKVLAN